MPISPQKRLSRIIKRANGLQPVAVALDVCISHVSMLSSGKRTPSGELAVKIQRVYGIPATAWFQAV